MLFKPELCEKVLRGEKTQTRRLALPSSGSDATEWEEAVIGMHGRVKEVVRVVYDGDTYYDRLKWQVGRTYAVQPGRGKPAVGRIRITAIRKERVQDITREDEIAEGFPLPLDFKNTWDRINDRPGCRIADNPEVWCLEFELVTEAEPA